MTARSFAHLPVRSSARRILALLYREALWDPASWTLDAQNIGSKLGLSVASVLIALDELSVAKLVDIQERDIHGKSRWLRIARLPVRPRSIASEPSLCDAVDGPSPGRRRTVVAVQDEFVHYLRPATDEESPRVCSRRTWARWTRSQLLRSS